MKGYTDIPYAKEAAALMQGPEVFGLDFEHKDFWFWMRVMHFENRYRCIDQLLQQTDNKNILELSSGYSFRGVDMCARNNEIHYVDTDLPEVVTIKQSMLNRLGLNKETRGIYELLPLNAMDEQAFGDTISRFDNGPVSIVNEGLLVYLDTEEKKRLCKTIYNTLRQRGGCWITADIYVRLPEDVQAKVPQNIKESAFMQQHKIEENKFDSYQAAETFFKEQGLELVQEAQPNYEGLSVMPHLLKVLPEEVRNSKEPPPQLQATWMLKAI